MVGYLVDEMRLLTSTRLFVVERYIKQLHGGSIRNIKLCVGNTWSTDLVIKDLTKTLAEVGVVTSTDYTILYDFDPVMDPLLNASLKSKTYDKWIDTL